MKHFVNTVAAENQMIHSSELSFLGNPKASTRILVVGNSITRHGPKEDIGWPFDWGMAASAPEKDYVHRLYAILRERGIEAYMRIRQGACWEVNIREEGYLSNFEEDRAFGAELVVFRLGENVKKENVPYLKDALSECLRFFCADGAKAVLTTCFNWEREEKDRIIREVSHETGFPCVEIGCTDERLLAIGKFDHHGVATHPGDEGMEMIAQRLADCIVPMLS